MTRKTTQSVRSVPSSTAPSNRRKPKVKGTCLICKRKTMNALVVRGKEYIDADGTKRKAADSHYHRECYRMQNKGLLSTGADKPKQNSVGKPCGGCNQTIEDGDNYAHRQGKPFHRECLF